MPNIHPIIVHFPIALLTIYGLFEILRLPILTRQSWYTPVKTAFLYLGTLGALVALQTGEWASGESESAIIEAHERFANITAWIFVFLSVAYLSKIEQVRKHLRHIETISLFVLRLAPILAFLGLIAITITGALGGAMVYGPDVDPIARIAYDLFVRD